MLSATVMYRVRWYDHEWVQMHLPGGMIFNWTAENTRAAATFARGAAPYRTGALLSTVRADNRTGGPHAIRSYVRAGSPAVPYARWVLEGTTGPITPHGRFLQVAPGRSSLTDRYYSVTSWGRNGRPVAFYARSVSGQKANNFLQRGVTMQLSAINAGLA